MLKDRAESITIEVMTSSDSLENLRIGQQSSMKIILVAGIEESFSYRFNQIWSILGWGIVLVVFSIQFMD